MVMNLWNMHCRGNVVAVVQKVIFNLKVRQLVASGKQPELLGKYKQNIINSSVVPYFVKY
jgi:hypothetical protein